ncbi:MAG TPA: hypothetical protein VMV89_05935, partial [Candidatus Paceibacterota bacterium]|nr:hypothetical protein [Candidatus Paceibacterota bacterium]
NLHNGTNRVYAIFSTPILTTLFTNWQVETELWPAKGTTQTNVLPFTVAAANRDILFLRAEDWTGVDSDGDGVPDWWVWEYWGVTTINTAAWDGANGCTLADDYAYGYTPAVFSFTGIEVTNSYVNTGNVPAQLDVTGSPYYIAVSVDDTNYAADAVWSLYASTNITVSLGATQGWHDVWIGLRGHADAPTNGIWHEVQFDLDATPLTLVLTNLGNYSGSRPFIDPAGYSTKSMSSLTFCVTNSQGGVSQDSGVVVDQGCNAADMCHVTNWFQCLDVALTLGTNYVGIQAVDWAGNVTVTNFSYVFDTNGDITPPVIALTWPQTSMEVAGNSFTLRGILDDDTATVTAQTTDTNNDVQTFNGLVERGGRFWLQNLPLNPGTNVITVTATDAANNSFSTNLTLVQSGVTLTMDTVDASQLNQVQVDVTGEISEPTYAVWVNGVQGTNNGGYWNANNVPVTAGGMASFDITAYPPGLRTQRQFLDQLCH